MRILILLLLASCVALGQGANPAYKSIKVINSDSTHGVIDGTIYRANDGLLRFMWGGVHYRFRTGSGISGLTTNRLIYATSATTIGDDPALTWDPVNNALTINSIRIYSFPSGSFNTNTFLGEGSGNFTLTPGITFNLGIGGNSLNSLTSGNANTCIGYLSGDALTSGQENTSIGYNSLGASTGNGNTALGYLSLSSTTGSNNIGIGHFSGSSLTSGSGNIIIGKSVDPPSNTASNQLAIQNIIFGTSNSGTGTTISTGNIGVGVSSPDRRFHVEHETGTLSTVTQVQRLTSTSSGTPTTGIGVGLEFEAETGISNNEVGANIQAVTTDVTSTSEDFDLVFSNMTNGAAATEKARIRSNGATVVQGIQRASSVKTTTYTITTADYAIGGDATSGTFTITLPTAASAPGQEFLIVKVDASGNAVNVDANGSETINGVTTPVPLSGEFEFARVQNFLGLYWVLTN